MSASDVNQDFGPELSMSHLPDEPNFTLPPSKLFLFSQTSKMIVSGSYDRRIRLWDVGSGKESGEPLRGHKITVSVVAASPDGTTNLAIEPIQAHSSKIDSISFSPDSTIIASLAGTKIKLWNVRTAKLIMEIESPSHERQIAFSPEGGRIAAVSHIPPDEQMLRIWDAKTGKPAAVSPIAGHTGGLLSVGMVPQWTTFGHCVV
ncbi:WD40-repeat-containing domain protein [Suillus occidentalis]|nr:WD40-repeat-containing domain protein [Suillus occidentalis]